MIPIQLVNDIMAKRDEQHGFGEPSKVEEFDTSDPTSASIDISTSESIDIGISETIDTDFCHRSIPLEILERSSCPQDIAYSTHKSIDVSSTYILVPETRMKRGFRKEPAGLCTICKSTREESIDTLQATSIDSVNQKSIDSIKREYQIPIQLLSYIMVEGDKQHVSGELSRVEEADFSDTTSASIDSNTSTSIDTTTSTSTNSTTSTSIDSTTSESIAHTIPTSIDGDSCFRSTPLEFLERSSCPQDIADSTHKSVDISSCDPTSDGDREITIEDFLELEEFLELEDGEKLEDLDLSREVTMEDFLELEEWA
ncbi:hypothetical protein F2Q70_00004659 [Brassica cretica]|uniref:Uncharacterized protein n=1 Tax=Brassica cretica TaxID=69181 RepID=A0A8S9IW51_BRACR|nr:hypothetical protein F2Q70_00004659 [Brassica cretica]